MALTAIEISHLSSFKFVPNDTGGDLRYNGIGMDSEWYKNLVHRSEVYVPYAQKAQFNDRNVVQIHSSWALAGGMDMQLIDRYGLVIHTFTSSAPIFVAGNIAHVTPEYNPYLYTFTFKFSFSSIPGLQEGIYYLVAKVNTDFSTYTYLVSEPISIRRKHPNTVLFEFNNSVNQFDTIFTQTDITCSFRVEGGLTKFTPDSIDTSYKDQANKETQLSSYPGRLWSLVIGGGTGVPDYVTDKVNRVLSCDNTKINGIAIVKDDSAKWEMTPGDRVALQGAAINVREAEPRDSLLYVDKTPVLMYTGGVFPHAINSLIISNLSVSKILLTEWIVEDRADEQRLLDYLNGTVAQDNELYGVFTIQGNDLIYTNAADEFYTSATAVIYTYYFQIPITFNLLSHEIEFIMWLSRATVSWEQHAAQNYIGDNTSDIFASHLFHNRNIAMGLPDSYTVRVFHNDTISKLFFYDDDFIKGINGRLSGTLKTLSFTNTAIVTFDGSSLSWCTNTLEELIVTDGSQHRLTAISPGTFSTGFFHLTHIDFGNQSLSSTEVDNIFIRFLADSAVFVPGTIITSGQIPAAPPTNASLTARNVITSFGWVLITD